MQIFRFFPYFSQELHKIFNIFTEKSMQYIQ